MDLERVVSAMIEMDVTAAEFCEFAVTWGVINDNFVQEVLHQLLINITAPSTPPEWKEEDADAILEMLKSPPSSDFEPWSPGFENAVLECEDAASASLVYLNDGEYMKKGNKFYCSRCQSHFYGYDNTPTRKDGKGYFIEQTLLLQGEINSLTLWGRKPDKPSTLQKEVEGAVAQQHIVKDFLVQVVLENLKTGMRDCAKQICFGCEFDCPGQKDHTVCLMTSPEDWILGYKFHEKALVFLNIYDVMNDWDDVIYEDRVEKNFVAKKGKGINVLLPDEQTEADRCWRYFKLNQRDLSDQWKHFWAKKLLESYKVKGKHPNVSIKRMKAVENHDK